MPIAAIFAFMKTGKFYLYLVMVFIVIAIISILVFQDDIRTFFHVETKQSLAVALSQQKDQQQKIVDVNTKMAEDLKKLDITNKLTVSSLIKMNDNNTAIDKANYSAKTKLDNEIQKINHSKPKTVTVKKINKVPHISKQAKAVINTIWDSYCEGMGVTCQPSQTKS